MWKVRLTTYIVAGIVSAAPLIPLLGLGTYDAATGMVDPNPFNIVHVAGLIAGLVSSALAAIAVALGWGRK